MKKLLMAGALAVAVVGGVFAATYDRAIGGTNGYPAFLGRKIYTISRTLDFSSYSNNILSGDYVKLINIPSTSIVLAVSYRMATVGTNSTTLDVGDSGSAARYVSNLDYTSAGSQTETIYATPTIKSSTDYIAMHADGDLGHTGVLVVKALLLDANEY